jgi:hypothetical protein
MLKTNPDERISSSDVVIEITKIEGKVDEKKTKSL